MKGKPPFEGEPGGPPPPSSDPFMLISYTMAHQGGIKVIRFDATVRRVRYVSRDGVRSSLLLIDAPESVGLNIQGPPEERDAYLLFQIDRAMMDELDSPVERPLIHLPPGLVRPS